MTRYRTVAQLAKYTPSNHQHGENQNMEATKVKDEARRLVEELPEDATWDDLMHKIYVRQAIESGVKDSDVGRTLDVKEVRTRFGLKP